MVMNVNSVDRKRNIDQVGKIEAGTDGDEMHA
jgi:hypothetical protein